MKSIYKSISTLGLAIAAVLGFSACQDDFDNRAPEFQAPVAEHEANMTIMEFKQLYWKDDDNYIDTVGYMRDSLGNETEEHIYISGRVISNDSEGNIFKSLVIADGTAALAFSINQYDLYLQYRPGQQIVIDATGMYVGKYRGLMQMGLPAWYENGGVYNASFMPIEFFRMHAELNGFPEPEKIDTIEVQTFADITNTPEGLMKWQSQLVKFNNVYFKNADGSTVFSSYKSSGVDQPIVDEAGATLNVRTSGYSTFWNNPLPSGNGDVCGILSYYNTNWQILLNDLAGCMNFGNPTIAPGKEDNPYTVDEAIATITGVLGKSGWVAGYIVGAVAPEVESVKSNDDIIWGADQILKNTLVIGQTPDTKEIGNALVIALPEGSALREYGNLVDHPELYKRGIKVRGTFGIFMDTYGVLDNPGTPAQFQIEGVEIDDGSVKDGDGTADKPYSVSQIVAKNPTSTTEAVETGVWVEGYIVGSMPTGGSSTTLSGTNFSTLDAATTNIVLGPSEFTTNYTECIGIQLPSGAIRNALNLSQNPGMLGAKVAIKGDVMKYCGGPGLKNATEYNVIGEGTGGGDTPDTPAAEEKGEGTVASPYNVAKALGIINGGSYTSDKVYVEGTISEIKEVDTGSYGNATYFISDDGTTANQLEVFRGYYLNGDKFTASDQIKVGDKVVVYGELTLYYSTPEITQGNQIYSINGTTAGGGGDEPSTGGEITGAGTEADPYTVSSILAGATGTGVWVKCYIVGWVSGTSFESGCNFNAEATVASNLVVADNPDETNPSNCIPVQLPTGAQRTALNLVDNPGNYKKCVLLCGSPATYFLVPGLKTVTDHKFVE